MFEGIMRTVQSLTGAGVVVAVGTLLVFVRGALRPADLQQRIDDRTARWLMPFLRSGGAVSQAQRQQIAALLPARDDPTPPGTEALVALEPWLRDPGRTRAELVVRSRAHAVRRLDAHDRALQGAPTLRAAIWRTRLAACTDELRSLVDAAVWLVRAATDRRRLRLSGHLAAWVGGGGALLSAVVVAGGTSRGVADAAGEISTSAAVLALLAALVGPARQRLCAAAAELRALPPRFRVVMTLGTLVVLALAALWQTGTIRALWAWTAQLADDLPTSWSVLLGGAVSGLMLLAVFIGGVRSALTRGVPLYDRLMTIGAVVLLGGAAVVGVVALVPVAAPFLSVATIAWITTLVGVTVAAGVVRITDDHRLATGLAAAGRPVPRGSWPYATASVVIAFTAAWILTSVVGTTTTAVVAQLVGVAAGLALGPLCVWAAVCLWLGDRRIRRADEAWRLAGAPGRTVAGGGEGAAASSGPPTDPGSLDRRPADASTMGA
jgi:hypothetical protein